MTSRSFMIVAAPPHRQTPTCTCLVWRQALITSRDEHAPRLRHRRALCRSRCKLARPVGASCVAASPQFMQALTCKMRGRCLHKLLGLATSTLHSSACGRHEHAPRLRHRRASCRSRCKLARPVGASWRLRRRAKQALCSTRVPKAETSTHHLESAIAVKQVQACSTSRSFVAAPSQRQANVVPAGA